MDQRTTANHLLVLTSYPYKGKVHGPCTVGIASYTKNTLFYLQKISDFQKKKLRITVLAEVLPGIKKGESYLENNITVKRLWQKNSLLTYWTLLKEIIREKDASKILFEFEISMFGKPLTLIPLPFFLLFLKFFGKKIILVPHQFINDINELSGHINLSRKSLKSKMLNLFISSFYFFTFKVSDKIIVFEEIFRQKLQKFVPQHKINVIPHGVEKKQNILTRSQARQLLKLKDDFIILYFGFLGWYKGTDWLVDRIQNADYRIQGKKIKLIIAGGENPNHENKPFYKIYCQNIKDKANKSNGKIKITGFIKEKDIPVFFSAADLVILPYRTFMSSSGPLSLAFTYDKPVILSDNLHDYLKTSDFSGNLLSSDLKSEDIFFPLDKEGLFNLLKEINDQKLAKMSEFSSKMEKSRNFMAIGRMYLKEII
ncbi:hypothetical protein A2W14_01590 [Candidatus Gottesmanbacteria bacterium RBG_16_37_8]|uniref:Glycosyl transferase family 1 domain-containing protein n=1 Tax=Candidatus Gottesmanbacteria bacterium RBG_16_37_8 TaxID=1798371 RepID=A0A1F5YR55_9BACT|nr:MAG: hypothetical protein A2W14_01590 [Candidatus Gottesmanbacteria bacterium RBG_16_37_8]